MEHIAGSLVGTLVGWLVASIFVHFAARIVLERSSFVSALISTLVGSLLAGLVQIGAIRLAWPAWAGALLSFAAMALAIAVFYRTKWTKGAVIGVVAALTWLLVSFLIGLLF